MQVRAEESACGVTLWGCNAAVVCRRMGHGYEVSRS